MSHPPVEGLNDPDLAKIIATMYRRLQVLYRFARFYKAKRAAEELNRMVMRIDLLIDERSNGNR